MTYDRHDVQIEFYGPTWDMIGPVDAFTDFKLVRHDLGDEGVGVCTFRVPFETSIMAESFTRSATTQTVYQWGPAGEIHCMVWIRGRLEHSGVVVVMEDEEVAGGSGDPRDTSINVQVESWGDAQAYLSRRDIKGTGGDRFAQTSQPADTCIENCINANCKLADIIEPSAYSGLGTSGVDRENFGSVLVQAATAASGSTVSMRWDHGESLWDQVAEKCRKHNCRLTTAWNKSASPPVLTITVQDYLDVVSDKTATVLFSRENGGLRKCPRVVDLGREANVAEVGGAGTRTNQHKGYAINQTSYDAIGLFETGEVWPSATAADAEEEAEYIIAEVGNCHTTYKPEIVETEDHTWGTDFEFDKVRVDDSIRGLTIQDWITKAEFALPEPGNLIVTLTLGRDEKNEDQKSQRSGGGGSGGKRAGGKPKRKNGEASAAKTINYDDNSVTFDEAEDELTDVSDTGDRIRPHSTGTDGGSGEGTTEYCLRYVEGVYHAVAPTPDGFVYLWEPTLQRNIKLLAADDPDWLGDPPTNPAIQGP